MIYDEEINMSITEQLRKIEKKILKQSKRKKELSIELNNIFRESPKIGFFKYTNTISKLELEVKKIYIEKELKIIEQNIKLLQFKFQMLRQKQKKIERGNKIILQMKKYKELITSKEEIDIEAKKIEYYKLYGICESLKITINLADFIFRQRYYNDENIDDINCIMERIDNNLTQEDGYLDIISFNGNEVYEKSFYIDKDDLWLKW